MHCLFCNRIDTYHSMKTDDILTLNYRIAEAYVGKISIAYDKGRGRICRDCLREIWDEIDGLNDPLAEQVKALKKEMSENRISVWIKWATKVKTTEVTP